MTSNVKLRLVPTFTIDPTQGPRISGWPKYDPTNRTTISILGISDSGGIPGDHFVIDEACEYWNTILPLYPQVRFLVERLAIMH